MSELYPPNAVENVVLFALTVEQAAAGLHVSKSFLDKLRVSGGGPRYLKLGNSIRYMPRDIEAWLNERRRVSTSEAA